MFLCLVSIPLLLFDLASSLCMNRLLPFLDIFKFFLDHVHVTFYSYCVRVSPAMANRMVDSARAVLNNYLPDVYIIVRHCLGGFYGI